MKQKLDNIKSDKAVILFTRIPEPGKVKTRMMPYLSPSECAELQECCIKDSLEMLREVDADKFICYEPSGDRNLLAELCKETNFIVQRGDDIGARMKNGLSDVFDIGYKSVLLMGSDIPEVKSSDITDAFSQLQSCDTVIGPSQDGGYYLIGMNDIKPELFTQSSYGHGKVLDELLHIAADNNIHVTLVAEHRDFDTKDDILYFREHIRHQHHLMESEVGKFVTKVLRVSVIVPTYNEEKRIDKLIKQLDDICDDAEIVIVDGGSTDSTLAHIPGRYRIVKSDKGRALQLNAGARAASGEVLFFMHADSELPNKPIHEIREVMKTHNAGCFGIEFQSDNLLMKINAAISKDRAFRRQIAFGDQGMFMTREVFEGVGGFPEIPIMEDYQLSLTLREMGIRIGATRGRICTSDRRYPKGNIKKLRLMFKMWLLRRKYRMGIDPYQIAKEYKDIR